MIFIWFWDGLSHTVCYCDVLFVFIATWPWWWWSMIVVDCWWACWMMWKKRKSNNIITTSASTFFSRTVISMLFKSTNIAVVLAAFLPGSFAFVPSNRPYHATARKSSLSMSSALIVQNKGGGHGELGKIPLRWYFCRLWDVVEYHVLISHKKN